jgi:hypothetical protein
MEMVIVPRLKYVEPYIASLCTVMLSHTHNFTVSSEFYTGITALRFVVYKWRRRGHETL